MTGVEILAINEIVTAYRFDWEIYLVSILAITIGMTIVAFLTIDQDLTSIIIGISTGIVCGVLFGLLPAKTTTPSEYETQYKVIISDEVSMNDFLERYEIIDQEGKIYTVRERDE